VGKNHVPNHQPDIILFTYIYIYLVHVQPWDQNSGHFLRSSELVNAYWPPASLINAKKICVDRTQKDAANLRYGPLPTRSGHFWNIVVNHVVLFTTGNLLGKLRVIHPNTFLPAKWTALYEVWGVLGFDPTIFQNFGHINMNKYEYIHRTPQKDAGQCFQNSSSMICSSYFQVVHFSICLGVTLSMLSKNRCTCVLEYNWKWFSQSRQLQQHQPFAMPLLALHKFQAKKQL